MKISDPLVSIIIPTFNRAHLIGETLDSIMAQTYQNWECIVVDDGSTDNTPEVMAEYVKRDSRIQYHHRPTNHKPGGNGARNFGLKISNGDYINWFDSDDLMHPEKLERQLKLLKNSSFNFTVCQSMIFEQHINNPIGLRSERIQSENALDDFVTQEIVFLITAPLFKKDFLLRNNLWFDENLRAAQEWEFFIRVLEVEPEYLTDPTPLAFNRKHPESITYSGNNIRNSVRLWNYYIARIKILKSTHLNPHTKQYLHQKIIEIYKSSLKRRHFKIAAKMYLSFIIKQPEITISQKLNAGFAGLAFVITGRGEKLLKRF